MRSENCRNIIRTDMLQCAYGKSFPATAADLLVLDTDRSSAFETTFPVGVSPSQHDTKLSGFTFDVGMSANKVRLS
jgi:hypothetical protein